MRTLGIDIETYSSVDLIKSGVYKYVESPDFSVLLFAYAWDDEPIIVIDLAQGEEIPYEISDYLNFDEVLKTAFNAQFERLCMSKHLGYDLPVDQWECTMIKSYMLGLPGALSQVAAVLNLENQKMKSGKALINYFSKPCRVTKKNGGRTRNLPYHDPDRWNTFVEYNRQDVEVEREIRNKLSFYKIPEKEKLLYCIDQDINDAGILINKTLVKNAIAMNDIFVDEKMGEMKRITGLENPNSVAQLKNWVLEQTGYEIASLGKDFIQGIIDHLENGYSAYQVADVLRTRQLISKTSVKKYQKMIDVECSDGRTRGLLQFVGANRTWRWAGRLIQVQNLPKNIMPDLDLARETVLGGDIDDLKMLYDKIPDVLSQLVRTAFIAPQGTRFVVADFSAIEARIISWLADEKWKLEVFAGHGKIYEAAASKMFHVPIEDIGKGSPLRSKGKVAELALGYQGGVGALIQMKALEMGIPEEELQGIVDAWRNSNKKIVKLWRIVGNAAIQCVDEKVDIKIAKGIIFFYRKGILFVRLPSGRNLSYMRACLGEGMYGKELKYDGMDQTTKQWKKISTYGGKLTENIIQAIARDCLAEMLIKLHEKKYKTVMHVHDEVICECPNSDKTALKDILALMNISPDWAKDLNLKGDGYETPYYLKD